MAEHPRQDPHLQHTLLPAHTVPGSQAALRSDLARIAHWVQPDSRVLDLGCGDGSLLSYLQQTKSVQGVGVEISDERVLACVRKGVHVVQQNLEDGLALFDDQQFDTVVL